MFQANGCLLEVHLANEERAESATQTKRRDCCYFELKRDQSLIKACPRIPEFCQTHSDSVRSQF